MQRVGGTASRRSGPRRLRNSDARRRWWARAGLALAALGLGCLVLAWFAARVAQPEALPVDPAGVTEVPPTSVMHNPWVLFADVEDPRRVPDLAEIGCRVEGDLTLPVQPEDMTAYGARVVEETSIAAVALLGRSGEDARVVCEGAADEAPLLLAPSSDAPPFAPSALVILGVVLLVAGALAHPATDEVPTRVRRMLARASDDDDA